VDDHIEKSVFLTNFAFCDVHSSSVQRMRFYAHYLLAHLRVRFRVSVALVTSFAHTPLSVRATCLRQCLVAAVDGCSDVCCTVLQVADNSAFISARVLLTYTSRSEVQRGSTGSRVLGMHMLLLFARRRALCGTRILAIKMTGKTVMALR
jgi:hypothetical protein